MSTLMPERERAPASVGVEHRGSRPKPAPIRLTKRGRRVVGAGLTLAVLLVAFFTLQAGSAIARVLRSSAQGHSTAHPSDPAVAQNALDLRAHREHVWGLAGSFVAPITHIELSAGFGNRGEHWALRHTGLDFVADWGTSVHSATAGTIIKTAHHPALGNVIVIRYAKGITIWYCHLSSIKRRHGHVGAGTIIGRVGSTGNATGPHLHLEVRVNDRQVDPFAFLFEYPAGTPGKVPAWLKKKVVPYNTL